MSNNTQRNDTIGVQSNRNVSVNKGVYYLIKRNKCILKIDPVLLNIFSTAKILQKKLMKCQSIYNLNIGIS